MEGLRFNSGSSASSYAIPLRCSLMWFTFLEYLPDQTF